MKVSPEVNAVQARRGPGSAGSETRGPRGVRARGKGWGSWRSVGVMAGEGYTEQTWGWDREVMESRRLEIGG